MQAVGGRIKTDIARHHARRQGIVQPFKIGAILHEATVDHHAQEFRFRFAQHRLVLFSRRGRL